MSLLLADLRMLANLPLTATGRRTLLANSVGLVLLGLVSWWMATEVTARPLLLAMLHQHTSGDSLLAMLAAGLLPCPVVATWLGLAMAQRQLFESTELGLWRTAPIRSWRPAVQILLRAAFVACCWATALSGPFLATLLQRTAASGTAYACLPLAIAANTVPLLALLLGLQLAMERFFAGRWLRMAFAVLGALASVGFSAWLLLGLFQNPESRVQSVLASANTDRTLLPTAEAAAQLLRAAARGELLTQPLLVTAAWLLGSLLCFAFLGQLHPRALQLRETAAALQLRRWQSRWNGGPTRMIARKEFAQLVQQPGAMLGFLVFGAMVYGLAHQRTIGGSLLADPHLPPDLAQLGAMMGLWFVAVLLVLYAHMGRIALWDGAQWPLYMSSPTPGATILRGKLIAVGGYLLWPMLLVGVIGRHEFGATPLTIARFLGLAVGGNCAALGVIATIGTWPRLMRPDEAGQIAQGGRNFFAAMAMVLVFELIAAPVLVAWLLWASQVRHQSPQDALPLLEAMTAIVAYGVLVLATGYLVGARNYRRLLAPRP